MVFNRMTRTVLAGLCSIVFGGQALAPISALRWNIAQLPERRTSCSRKTRSS